MGDLPRHWLNVTSEKSKQEQFMVWFQVLELVCTNRVRDETKFRGKCSDRGESVSDVELRTRFDRGLSGETRKVQFECQDYREITFLRSTQVTRSTCNTD